MTLWIEFRCNGRTGFNDDHCLSNLNNGPMGACDENAVAELLADLSREGREAGWVRRRGDGWWCPSCLKAERAPSPSQEEG